MLKRLSIHCPWHSPARPVALQERSGTRPTGMQLKREASWRSGVETPPFVADNASAVEFLKAVLDSVVGTPIIHIFSITYAVA
eukprot:5319519-Pleurochrysis_carterae.AAC.1